MFSQEIPEEEEQLRRLQFPQTQVHSNTAKSKLTSRKRKKKMAADEVATSLIARTQTKNTEYARAREHSASARKSHNSCENEMPITSGNVHKRESDKPHESTNSFCELLYAVQRVT
ncbi:jg16722 [Pararge aegeria aegeria]|uniref:Jg16722 protein n=1 Tax=Pararge aegeria aegeria TaxID=348720 RepID=A0A8S4S187_9NEOP|nr:jg16722 [Pararge aegeria aegeria]